MDPGEGQSSAFPKPGEREWDQAARRSEGDGAVQERGRGLLRAPGPSRAERHRLLAVRLASREHMNLNAPVSCDLDGDVGGGAEAEETEPLARHDSRELERPIADDPGAKKGRRGFVGKRFREAVEEALGRDSILRVAAVHVVAGEARLVAEVFLAPPAEEAATATKVKPGESHALAEPQAVSALSEAIHSPDDLVARHEGEPGEWKLALHFMEIGVAEPAD